MHVKLPYPPEEAAGCMSTTLPAAAERLAVPAGTPMSMPGWQDSHARDSQNGEVIGPLTGQISPPEPCLIAPGAIEGPARASLAWFLAGAAFSEPMSSSSWWRRLTEDASRVFLAERAVASRSRWV